MTPKATVIVPAFYHRSNLLRCLEAWRRQTVAPDQLIIVNDGGHDDLRLDDGEQLVHVPDRGGYIWHSVNLAVRAAWPSVRNDLIVLCACDLLFQSTALESIIESQVGDQRSTATVYGLDKATTDRLDDIPWRETECAVFQSLDGFHKMRNTFQGRNETSHEWRHHILFNANTRAGWERWERLAFPARVERDADMDWLREREVEAGRAITDLPFPVYHQWHPSKDRVSLRYNIEHESGGDVPGRPGESVRVARATVRGE